MLHMQQAGRFRPRGALGAQSAAATETQQTGSTVPMHTAERLPVLSPRGPRKSEVWAHLKELVTQNKLLGLGKNRQFFLCLAVHWSWFFFNVLFKPGGKREECVACSERRQKRRRRRGFA